MTTVAVVRKGTHVAIAADGLVTLKQHFFLNTKEEDAGPYESSQFTVPIANPHGLSGVYSYREVFEFDGGLAAANSTTTRPRRCGCTRSN